MSLRVIDADPAAAREREVWACLEGVMDPELDESVTELNFVTHARVDAQMCVHIGFRLPTYWCAANFSFLMADDMRQAVAALPWVSGVDVVLGEHMYADKINAGLALGLSFQETFGDEANGDLDDLRRTFLIKAFQRRQASLMRYLLDQGYGEDTLVAMTTGALGGLVLEPEGAKLRTRYLERREVVSAAPQTALAFVDAEGAPLTSAGFARYVSGIRRVGVNAEFNGALCRGLLAVRFDLETPLPTRPRAVAAP